MNLVRNLARKVQRMARRPKQRVFGIGLNKTGTTSLATALQQLGFDVAPQEPFEALFDDWAARRFDRIIRLCRRWQAFQDIPFSLPFTFQALDAAYPGSLFVQTVRTTEEQWLSSLLRYHAVVFGRGATPTRDDLASATYAGLGWALRVQRGVFMVGDDEPYNRDALLATYRYHNETIRRYFALRHGQLLVLDVSAPDAYSRLCTFVGRPPEERPFPVVNRTNANVAIRNALEVAANDGSPIRPHS